MIIFVPRWDRLPPQKISKRPVLIRVDFHKLRSKDPGLLLGDEEFVFGTA